MIKLDNTGRLTIPKEYRSKYGFGSLTEVDITDLGDGISIKPLSQVSIIKSEELDELRKLYLMLSENNLLDDKFEKIMSSITKKSTIKCEKCGCNLFMDNNTYKCYKCK